MRRRRRWRTSAARSKSLQLAVCFRGRGAAYAVGRIFYALFAPAPARAVKHLRSSQKVNKMQPYSCFAIQAIP